MEYVDITGEIIKFQGESITKWYDKTSGAIFESNEGAYWTLTDPNGNQVTNGTGTLSKSGDNKKIGFTVGKTVTVPLLESYLLLVRATDSNDESVDDVFARYDIAINDLKAK